jgi:DNA (cytosine-5)-methyltransferase 1
MRGWKRFQNWKGKLTDLGYNIREQVLNSVDFNVPQSRKRLYVICDRETEPPLVTPPPTRERLPADCIINKNGAYRFSLLRSDGRAEATLQRADRAIAELGNDSPFLLVYYGSDGSGGWQKVDAPLRTITTVDRFAYVRPDEDGQHEMRMLQVPELKKAMGFPEDFKMEHGTRRDRIKLLGNAVCPPVMKAIVETITANQL